MKQLITMQFVEQPWQHCEEKVNLLLASTTAPSYSCKTAPLYLVWRRRQCVMVAPSSTWHSLILGERKSKLQHFLGKPSPKKRYILVI